MKTYIVDSFTDQPFKGNPAGVCHQTQDLSVVEMSNIAKELGFSETAFIRELDSEDRFSIRFFSPKMEIPLCGHATLAAAKTIFASNDLSRIVFVNIQNIELAVEKIDSEIVMEFPLYKTVNSSAPSELLEAIGLKNIIACVYNEETNILLIEIEDSDLLKALKPDFNRLYNSHDSINGVLVTACSNTDDYDFHSRYFWPWSGTNEDPATGGTHTFLAPYWAKKLNKSKMRSFQSSERTGFMEVEINGPATFLIKSQAVIVFEGELKI